MQKFKDLLVEAGIGQMTVDYIVQGLDEEGLEVVAVRSDSDGQAIADMLRNRG